MKAQREMSASGPAEHADFITIHVGDQAFGLDIQHVQDVFIAHGITPVPKAPADIAGLLNLRGRVVTAISLRSRLGLPERDARGGTMVVGVERHGESYGLLVDSVGEVLSTPVAALEPLPINFHRAWASVARSVHRLDSALMVILDIDAILDPRSGAQAA
jgi:purine-binding chemotaxis protein CheW